MKKSSRKRKSASVMSKGGMIMDSKQVVLITGSSTGFG